MLNALNKDAAFASIAWQIETFVPMLASTDRSEQLAAVSNIGDALLSAHLTFRDLAERVTAPRPAADPVYEAYLQHEEAGGTLEGAVIASMSPKPEHDD